MARGWESKSVELQQEQAGEKPARVSPRMTADEAAVFRKKENLRLSRQTIVHRLESTSNPRHRKLLEETLAALDQELARL